MDSTEDSATEEMLLTSFQCGRRIEVCHVVPCAQVHYRSPDLHGAALQSRLWARVIVPRVFFISISILWRVEPHALEHSFNKPPSSKPFHNIHIAPGIVRRPGVWIIRGLRKSQPSDIEQLRNLPAWRQIGYIDVRVLLLRTSDHGYFAAIVCCRDARQPQKLSRIRALCYLMDRPENLPGCRIRAHFAELAIALPIHKR